MRSLRGFKNHSFVLTALISVSASLLVTGCQTDSSQYVAPQPAPSAPGSSQNNCIPPSPSPTPSQTACTGPFCGGGVLGQYQKPVAYVESTCPTTAPALLSFDGSITNFGVSSIGSHTERTLTVANFGGTAATAISAGALQDGFSYLGGAYPGTGGTCGAELAAGANCTLVIDFYPQNLQEYLSPIRLGYFDGQAQQTLAADLTAIGVAYPTLSFQSPTLDFGSVVVQNSVSQTVTVQYAGTYPATGLSAQSLGNGFSFVGGSYPGTGGTCGAQISANCTLVLAATPTTTGQSSYTLNLDYDNGAFAASASLGLSVNGVVAPTAAQLTITPDAADPNGNFGNQTVGTQRTAIFTVTNSGSLTATAVSAAALTSGEFSFAGGNYPGAGGTCGSQITTNCTIALTFAPNAQGPVSDQIQLNYMNGISPQAQSAKLGISGVGSVPANLAWSGPSPYDFGTQSLGATTSNTFTITNTSQTVAANGLQFSGTSGVFNIVSSSCASSLAPGASCQVVVSYTPNAVGSFDDSVTAIYSNGSAQASAAQELIGQGTDAALLVFQPASANFGSVVLGSSVTQTFNVQYFGAQPASQINWSAMNGPNYYYDGGTCSTVINANCTVAIKFLPSALGTVTTPVLLLYNDGYGTQTATLATQANAISAGNVTFSTGASYDFGQVSVGAQAQTQITVTNSGGDTASQLSFGALSAPFTMLQNGCGSSLAPGASCVLTVAFQPTSATSYNQALQLSYQSGLGVTSVSTLLEGTGSASPTLGLGGGSGGGNGSQSLSYNFGNVYVGQTSSVASFTIIYTGESPALIQSVSGASGPDFYFDTGTSFPGSGTCGATQITATCTFNLVFKPSQAGSRSSTFKLVYSNGSTQQTLSIALSGKGLAPAVASVSSGSASFASTPLHYTRVSVLSISNAASAGVAAKLTGFAGIAAPFGYAGGSCFGANGSSPISIAPGSSCTIKLTFDPTTVGTFNDSLAVSYFDGTQNQAFSIAASGSGTSAAVLVLEQGASYNFGNVVVGASASASISVSYYGADSASIQSIQVASPFATTASTTCGSSVSGNCVIGVSFAPTSSGAVSGTLTVAYNDGTGATQTAKVNLSGTGKTTALLAGPASLTFPSTLVNSTSVQTITLTNSGASPASQIQISALTAPYSLSANTCTSSVSSSCQIGISFAPTSSGAVSQNLTISYNDGSAAQTLSIALNGAGATAPNLSSNPQGSFASVAFGGQSSLTFSITNSGTETANGLSIQNPASSSFKITQNTCSGALAVNQSCLVTVLFSPAIPGPLTDSFSIAYSGSVGGSYAMTQALSAQSTVPVQLATKGNHTCVINTFGQVECWGEDDYGQTGPGQKVVIPLGTGHYATAIATGFFHSCAILENGQLKCWGRNDEGQLGQGDTVNRGLSLNDLGDNLPAINLGTGRTAKAVSAGYSHTCAILDDGSVKCWGQNTQGQLGQGNTGTIGAAPGDMAALQPIDLGTGLTAVSIDSNVGHNCAILSNQTLKCWGDNFYGELGLGDAVNRGDQPNQMGDNLPSVSLQAGSIPVQVSTGGGFTCVTSQQGQVSCWGLNYHGTLGTCWALDSQGNIGSCFNPQYTNYVQGYGLTSGEMGSNLPFIDLGLSEQSIPVSSVSSGTSFTCAQYPATSGGSVPGGMKCWGDNTKGQLGLGDLVNRGDQPNEMGANLPSLDLGTSAAIVSIHAGSYHTCAVFADNSVRCWGDNSQGQLGMDLSIPNWGGAANQMGSNLPAVGL